MKIEHALIAIDQEGKIIHLIAYEGPPDYVAYFEMVDELKNDPQFELTHLDCGKDFIIAPANEETLEMIRATIKKRPDDFSVVSHGLEVTE